MPPDDGIAPGPHAVPQAPEPLSFDRPGVEVAAHGGRHDVVVHVAPARRGRRIAHGGDIPVVAVDMFDREDGVEAEGQHPAPDEHRGLVPGAVRQLVRGDRAHHADHQAGLQHEGQCVLRHGHHPPGEQVVPGERADPGAEAQRVARADAPDRDEHDHRQQRQGQPELHGQDAGMAVVRRSHVVAEQPVAQQVERGKGPQADGDPRAAGQHGGGHREGDGVEQEELEVVPDAGRVPGRLRSRRAGRACAGDRSRRRGALPRGETVGVDVFGGHAVRAQHRHGRIDHGRRAAQVGMGTVFQKTRHAVGHQPALAGPFGPGRHRRQHRNDPKAIGPLPGDGFDLVERVEVLRRTRAEQQRDGSPHTGGSRLLQQREQGRQAAAAGHQQQRGAAFTQPEVALRAFDGD